MKRKRFLFLGAFILCCAFLFTPASAEYIHAHQWGEWEVDEPTCGYEGSRYRYCLLCWELEEIILPAIGNHKWEVLTSEKATCIDNGYKYQECSVCDEWAETIIPATKKHSIVPWFLLWENNCMNSGEMIRYCEYCNYEESKIVPKDPKKHHYSKWWTIKKATIFKQGQKTRICYVCGTQQKGTISKVKSKVVLNKKLVTLKKGKTYTLKIKSQTKGDKKVRWASSNKNVATVSSKGKIKAKTKGTATVTLYMKSGTKVSCKIKVK